MSGHSKWSQIKRAKGANDVKRGMIFAKLSKKISIAAREGGSGDPNHNFRLRLAIDKAKEVSMPSDNIDRAIKKGVGADGGAAIEEVIYEGYGPHSTAFIVEAATDNKNRTVQNIKHIFSKHNGSMGAQGSVAWQFVTRGQILIERGAEDMEKITLTAIDAGAEDVQESEEGLTIYTNQHSLEAVKNTILNLNIKIAQAETIKESSQPLILTPEQQGEVEKLTNALEDNEDVIAVHTNIA